MWREPAFPACVFVLRGGLLEPITRFLLDLP